MNSIGKGWVALVAMAASLGGCASGGSDGWTTLVDGTRGMENFVAVGDAQWSASDGAIQASQGGKDPGYLLSKGSYKDFVVRVEFWASDDANSGIFMRCQNPQLVNDETCYEANIFDQRPDPSFGTGAIVKVAKVPSPMPKAGGKWNTYEITMRGSKLRVVLNGETTAEIDDAKFASGPLALQWGRGTIKFRKVQIRSL
jgi:hypothetical protein